MSLPTIGIDFGTTTSSMAWVDPESGKAGVIKNAEGEERTPSVVYFGAETTLVGTPAEHMLEHEEERLRVVASIKRELVNAPTLALPERQVKAVEVAAELLNKLKRDAEELHFHEPVTRAVVTCPAAFGTLERAEIERAAILAGFTDARLLDEPVAAALAYSRDGLKVGRHVLVYDLGGGTFDLALLRQEDGEFELVMEPKGLRRCGGDDFDEALYDYCDELAQRQWGEPIDGQGRDLKFLHDCRKRKENLSAHNKALFSSLVGTGRIFKHSLTRAEFERLIENRVATTVRLTAELVRMASAQDLAVETVVLIGGSSRIPLVQNKLAEALPVAPRKYANQDVAVALGAAYFAQEIWEPQPIGRLAKYRSAVEMAWADGHIDGTEVERLIALATQLRLSREQAEDIERHVIGDIKEAVVRPPQPIPDPVMRTNVIVVPDGTGDAETIEDALEMVAENGIIRLWPGEHRLKMPLAIKKPIRIIGAGMETTTIKGEGEGYVITYSGTGNLFLEGATFCHMGATFANAVSVVQGEVDFSYCRFTGGSVQGKHFGSGLALEGKVTGKIRGCRAENNAGAGITIGGEVNVLLEENVCEGNKNAGVLYIGSAEGVARKNRCSGNETSGIAIQEQAKPRLEQNVCEGNKKDGILYTGSAEGVAHKNRCVGNETSGIAIQEQAKPLLEVNVCASNKQAGIQFLGSAEGVAHKNRCVGNETSGIAIQEQAKPQLEENICENNKHDGILYTGSAEGIARKNHCAGNETSGIAIQKQAKPQLEENICENNKQDGILYTGSAEGVARKNHCVQNETSGIAIQEQAKPQLQENICEKNAQAGIKYLDNARGAAKQNQCIRNEMSGIDVQGQARPTLVDNLCTENRGDGIYYNTQDLAGAGGVARRNVCEGNGGAFGTFINANGNGIWVFSGGVLLEANTCRKNKSYGILISTGSKVTLRENQCSGNVSGGVKDKR